MADEKIVNFPGKNNEEEVNKECQLSDKDLNDILGAMKENVDKNKNLKMIADLPSNNGIESAASNVVNEEFEATKAAVKIDPKTGEHCVIESGIEESEKKEVEDIFGDMSELDDIDIDEDNISIDEVKKVATDQASMLNGKYEISDETALALIDVINKYKAEKEIKYKDLPDQVKGFIDEYLKSLGVAGFTVEANTMRNTITEMLINEYSTNIASNKYIDSFNSEIEKIYDKANNEISSMIKEYDNDKIKYLEAALEKVEDEEKKEKIQKIIESINDAYSLNRIKDYLKDHKIKVKKFDMEKPKKIFDYFNIKYKDSHYNIYDPSLAVQILARHLDNDVTSATLFMIVFCKFCLNYKPEVAEEHAFMYYTIYNIVLLDAYKGDQYNEFAPKFLENIKEILSHYTEE